MNILQKIEKKLVDEAKNPKFAHKNFLKLVKSELQAEELRKGKSLSNEQESGILNKIQKSNNETILLLIKTGRQSEADVLQSENELLKDFIPKELPVNLIKEHLAYIAENLKLAKNRGQAIGIAMKTLKEKFPDFSISASVVSSEVNLMGM